MRSIGLVLILTVAGCGGAQTVVSAPARRAQSVRWSSVVDTPPCFYFSGPEALGRDDHLGTHAILSTDAQRIRLDFGDNVVFSGELRNGHVSLHRSSSHDFGSGKWEADESITLQEAPEGTWSGHYHYDERDPATHEVGRCHIDASIAITPAG